MAKKRPKVVPLQGPVSRVAESIAHCGRAKALEIDVNKSLASCLLYDCAKDDKVIFDSTCHSCVVNRRTILPKLNADELRSIFRELFDLDPVGPWDVIHENVVAAIGYEIERLAHKRYEDYRARLFAERQKDVISRCRLTKQEIADYNDGKEVKRVMAKKRTDKEKKGGESKKKSSSSGGKGDKVAKALADATPKQMLKIAKDYGVDSDKLKKVKKAVDDGTQAGLIRMRIGNLMRGVDNAKKK